MTLHSAKGLEFDNVFIVAVEQDVLPHARSKEDLKQLEEERRLFFVGITRARRNLQISNASTRGFGGSRLGSPSQFLIELPRGEMTMVDYTRANPRDLSWEDPDSGDHGDSGDWDVNQDLGSDQDFEVEYDTGKSKKKTKPLGKRVASEEDFDEYCQEPVPERQAAFGGIKTGSSIGASITLAGTPVDHFESGTRISHPRYGLGSVMSVDGFGPKRMARISFDSGETKSFQLSKSPIDIV
jgi:DNA helicase-2/ATP-dependent DNA helicase PcrA